MIDKQRWMQFTLAQQLGHIGSELSRARYWERNHDLSSRQEALVRALALLDLTLEDQRLKSRLKEPARLREVVSDWFSGQHYYDISSDELEEYCTVFAVRARA